MLLSDPCSCSWCRIVRPCHSSRIHLKISVKLIDGHFLPTPSIDHHVHVVPISSGQHRKESNKIVWLWKVRSWLWSSVKRVLWSLSNVQHIRVESTSNRHLQTASLRSSWGTGGTGGWTNGQTGRRTSQRITYFIYSSRILHWQQQWGLFCSCSVTAVSFYILTCLCEFVE